eukprot:m.71328 g.71328  ORF g.71328 m.71328 type:complete len:58 (-) comp12236_c0_seq4:121-294(-)
MLFLQNAKLQDPPQLYALESENPAAQSQNEQYFVLLPPELSLQQAPKPTENYFKNNF